MRVGFVGAGLMGAPMVRRLIAAGHEVTISSRRPARLEGAGWKVVRSPADAAAEAEVVCSIVPDSPEVTEVVTSLLEKAAPGTVIVEMSTISPATAKELAGRCAEAGVDYLDCPVSGGPPGAEAGTLAIWVGGKAEALQRARPVLEVIGQANRIRHCGPVGAGLAVKLANNFLGAVNAAASAEALALARDSGVDPVLVVEAVSDGTGANWQLANLFPRKVLQGDFEPGFRITHMAKDLRIAAEVAERQGLDTPMLALARHRLDEAMSRFGEERDYGAVARLSGW